MDFIFQHFPLFFYISFFLAKCPFSISLNSILQKFHAFDFLNYLLCIISNIHFYAVLFSCFASNCENTVKPSRTPFFTVGRLKRFRGIQCLRETVIALRYTIASGFHYQCTFCGATKQMWSFGCTELAAKVRNLLMH